VTVSQKSSNGASLWEEKACLDCFITENRPEVGLEKLLELSTMSDGSTPRPQGGFADAAFLRTSKGRLAVTVLQAFAVERVNQKALPGVVVL